MDFNTFMGKVKKVTNVPVQYFDQKLKNAIRFSDSSTKSTFFGSDAPQSFLTVNPDKLTPLMQELAVKYVAYLVSKNPAFGFDKTVNATDATINDWFKKNANSVGQNLLVDYMMEPEQLGPIHKDPNFTAKTIADNIGNNNFLNALMIECDTLGSIVPIHTLLLMMKILDNSGPDYKRVVNTWSSNSRWKEISGFDQYPWLNTNRESLRQNGQVYGVLYPYVRSAIQKADPPIHHNVYPRSGLHYVSPNPIDYIKTVYGSAVMRWLKSRASGDNLYTSVAVQNTTDAPVNSGCVIGGTLISMADGSHKKIEEIQSGDALLSSADNTAYATGELLPNANLTAIYSVNSDEPFMSVDHAMMTQRGWCSMAPSLTHEIMPHLEVGTLSVGDVVWKVKSYQDGKATYEKIEVKNINVKPVNPEDSVVGYVLHQRGHHTNHVNGYCCHSGYPEITMQWMTGNVASRMNSKEQVDFSKEFENLSPQFEKVLGTGVTNLIMQSLKHARTISAQADHTDNHGRIVSIHKTPKSIVFPTMEVLHIDGDHSLTSSIKEIGLYNGQCFIDGVMAESYSDNEHIYWERQVGKETEYGVMKMLPHGMRGLGRITRGSLIANFSAEGNVSYDLVVGPTQEPWLRFTMGFAKDENGNSYKTGSIEAYDDDDLTKTLQKHSSVRFSLIDDKNSFEVLRVEIDFDAVLPSNDVIPFIKAEFDFSMNYRNVVGKAYEYDDSKPDYAGATQDVMGTVVQSSILEAMQSQVTKRMIDLPVQTGFLHVQPASNIERILANPAYSTEGLPFDIEQLFSLPAPDLPYVHETGFAKLKDLMMLALSIEDPKWLDFFGETAPSVGAGMDLNQAEADLLKNEKVNRFLIDKFAIGYLTQSFSKSTDDKIKTKFDALSNVDEKLGYFWKGDGDQSFVKDPGYNQATSKINDFVYASSVSGFEKFMGDKSPEWAKQLYDYCTKKEVMDGLAFTNDLGGRKKLTHLSSMLHALDPKGRLEKKDPGTSFFRAMAKKEVSYSTALFEEVLGTKMKNFSNKTILAGEDEYNAFLIEYFKQYFAKIVDDGSKMSAEVRAAARKELDALMRETGAQNHDALLEQLNSVIESSVSFIIGLKNGPLGVKIQKWAKGYAKANPVKGKIGTLIAGTLTMGTYAFGMFQVITTFMGFDKLKPEQQVSLVATTLDLTSSVFGDITKFKAARVLSSAQSSLDEIIDATDALQAITDDSQFFEAVNAVSLDRDLLFAEFDSPGIAQAAENLSGAINEAEEILASEAKWSKIAAVGEVVSRSFSIVALAAGAVVTGFQIANDFATNQPASIKALDILQEISTAVSFTIEVGSGIAALAGAELAAAIPIVGAIIAAVGILISIILMFIHRKPPPSPIEIFVDKQCIPFLNGLPLPPQKWLDAQKKVVDHLTGDKSKNSMSVLLSPY